MKPKRILLIDDQAGITRLLKLTLQKAGAYLVREENDSTRACATAREFDPDIVFCDVDMPGIDGADVARQIREDRRLAHIPIVFLTTLVDSKEVAEIDGLPVMAKPVSVEKIIRCIEELTATPAV